MSDLFSAKDLFSREHSSKEKFDYFICSVAGALFAYIGQTYTPHKLDSWFYYLTPLALFLLALSFACGLIRIYVSNDVIKLNKYIMRNFEDCISISEELRKGSTTFTDHAGNVLSRKDLEDKRVLKNKLIKHDESQIQSRNTIARLLGVGRDLFLTFGFILILGSKILQPYQ
jgi:hypothetical protein